MRRWYVWAIGSLLLVGVLIWGYGEWSNGKRLANALESNYQRDFYTVLNQVGQLESLLSKGLVSGSPRQQVFLLTEIWSRANMAQSALGQLPFTELNLSASRKFLAQMGDYAYALAKRVARGDSLQAEQKKQLQSFYREVREYGMVLKNTEKDLHQSSYRWANVMGRQKPRGLATRKPRVTGSELDGIKEMDQRFDGLPVLLYDGPFSDRVEEIQPKGLSDDDAEVSQAQAERKAEQFMRRISEGNYKVTRSEQIDGSIPAYGITLNGRVGMAAIDMSIKGGRILSFLNSRPITTAKLSEAEAEAKASNFLAEIGYHSMEKTYAISDQNARWVVFTATDNAVRLYPDQVKVQVALDNGEIIGFNGVMYILNHHERQLPKPKLSQEEAQKKLSPALTIKSSRLALIPLTGGREVLTYEFLAEYEGEDYLVYINALTGDEENILKLILAPQGEFAI